MTDLPYVLRRLVLVSAPALPSAPPSCPVPCLYHEAESQTDLRWLACRLKMLSR